MDAMQKAAVITWLLDKKIKLIHVWPMGGGFTCMLETATGGRRNAIPEKVACGTGDDALGAVRAALANYGGDGLEFRLFILGFAVEHLAQRSAIGYLRRIEGGR
jgi:hypothetical protein